MGQRVSIEEHHPETHTDIVRMLNPIICTRVAAAVPAYCRFASYVVAERLPFRPEPEAAPLRLRRVIPILICAPQ
jgi:hypothetical protein